MRTYRTAFLLAVLVMALAACASPAVDPPEESGVTLPTATASATLPLVDTTALIEQLATDTPTPSAAEGMDVPLVPYNITGPEIIAANVPDSTYSGYACVVSPLGCACELPELRRSTFTFTAEGALVFAFTLDQYTDSWELFRVGPNQWEFASSILSEELGAEIGQARAILSFTLDGYILTQAFDFYETGFVTCPDITYRRLIGSGQP